VEISYEALELGGKPQDERPIDLLSLSPTPGGRSADSLMGSNELL